MKIPSLPVEFHKFCIDYSSLKYKLKPPYTDQVEHEFISLFDHEMKKVFDFISIKQGELTASSEDLESRSKSIDVSGDVEALQEELRYFVEFVRINVYLFERILKKHDKKTRYVLRPMYRTRLRMIANDAEIFDNLFYRISKISLSMGGNEIKKTASSFIRKTSKYWVPKKNVNALKSMIVRHLPIYVHEAAVDKELQDIMDQNEYEAEEATLSKNTSENSLSTKMSSTVSTSVVNKLTETMNHPNNLSARRGLSHIKKPELLNSNTELQSPYHAWDSRYHDTCVSSIYLDNESFELYRGRLHKHQGAEAIRIRWYTSREQEIVFIERKKHQESWTGEQSAKLRFNIPEQCVNDYILGKNVWKHVESCNSDRETAFVLYTEIQNAIKNKNLRPVLRTFYKRTAFQLPNDAQVRVSLDTHLCMIKENTGVFTNWRRLDINCDFPFDNLKSNEIVRFPHAILEVKIQGENQPSWVEEIISGSYVEAVDNFSKYMHGCAILYPQITDIPYWLPQCHIDINREPIHEISELNSLIEPGPISVTSSRLEVVDVEDKRIAIPIRVEPKVFFANERTFLSWLHFSIFIGGIGTAMLGLGDHRAMYSGIVFIITSVIFALYALYLYLWRAGMIREKNPGPYDDLYGPIALVFVFLLAMMLSMIFKLRLH